MFSLPLRSVCPAALIALLAASCSGHNRPLSQPAPDWSTNFPALSELQDYKAAAKAASDCESVMHAGAAYDLSLPLQNVAPGFGGAMFSPATVAGDEFNTMAYAIYALDASAYEGAAELHTYWDGPLSPGVLWLGFSDFSQSRWRWINPGTTNVPNFGSVADDRNALGALFVAVVLLGNTATQLNMLRLGAPDVCGSVGVSPLAGLAPATMNFDISGLYVAGESFVSCDWDFENDGVVDDTGLSAHSYLYSSAGNFELKLTFQCNLGDAVSLLVPVNVLDGNWEVQPLAVPASGLYHYSSPCLAEVGGVPWLAYVEEFDGNPPDEPAYRGFIFRRAGDAQAQAWDPPFRLGDGVTRLYSLIDAGGMPYVLGGTTPAPDEYLLIGFATDPSLSGWGVTSGIGALAGTEHCADMAMVNGNVCIAFRDNADKINFVYANGSDLSQLSPALNTTWDCNGSLALADVGGYPALAAERFPGFQQVAYLYSTSHTGDLGTWSAYFSDALFTGTPSLAWVNGAPVLTAYTGLDFQYNVGDAPAGLNLWRSAAAGSGGLGEWCSIGGLCLDGAVFVASKTSAASMGYTLVHDDGSTISCDSDIVELGGSPDLGTHCDAICVDGVPMVAYADTTNEAIHFAVMR